MTNMKKKNKTRVSILALLCYLLALAFLLYGIYMINYSIDYVDNYENVDMIDTETMIQYVITSSASYLGFAVLFLASGCILWNLKNMHPKLERAISQKIKEATEDVIIDANNPYYDDFNDPKVGDVSDSFNEFKVPDTHAEFDSPEAEVADAHDSFDSPEDDNVPEGFNKSANAFGTLKPDDTSGDPGSLETTEVPAAIEPTEEGEVSDDLKSDESFGVLKAQNPADAPEGSDTCEAPAEGLKLTDLFDDISDENTQHGKNKSETDLTYTRVRDIFERK